MPKSDRWHAYYTCCKEYDIINTEKGKELECPVCGAKNAPRNENKVVRKLKLFEIYIYARDLE